MPETEGKRELQVRRARHGRSRLVSDLDTGPGNLGFNINLETQNAALGLHEFRNWK